MILKLGFMALAAVEILTTKSHRSERAHPAVTCHALVAGARGDDLDHHVGRAAQGAAARGRLAPWEDHGDVWFAAVAGAEEVLELRARGLIGCSM